MTVRTVRAIGALAVVVAAIAGAATATSLADPATRDDRGDKRRAPDAHAPPADPRAPAAGASKRTAGDDYAPRSAPTRADHGKKLVLGEQTIVGRVQKPLASWEPVAAPPPRIAPSAAVPTDVRSALDALDALHRYASARGEHFARTRQPDRAAAAWDAARTDTTAAIAAALAAFLNGAPASNDAAAAEVAIALADVARDDEAGGSDAARIAAVLGRVSGANRRAVAYALVARDDRPGVALAVVCPQAAPEEPASADELAACTADGLTAAQAAYGWAMVGEAFQDRPDVAAAAYDRALRAATAATPPDPDLAIALGQQLGMALRDAHRSDAAAVAFADALERAVARGDGSTVDDVERQLAGALMTPATADDDPDRDGLGEPATALTRIAAVFARAPDDRERARITAGLASGHLDMLDRPGAVQLFRAALAEQPLASDAPSWHVDLVRSLRDPAAREAEIRAFVAAYGAQSAWQDRHVQDAGAMSALAAAARALERLRQVPAAAFDAAGVGDAIGSGRRAFESCFSGSGVPDVAFTLAFDVTASGDVASASVFGVADADRATCVATIARRLWLPAPGAPRSVSAPLHFASQ